MMEMDLVSSSQLKKKKKKNRVYTGLTNRKINRID